MGLFSYALEGNLGKFHKELKVLSKEENRSTFGLFCNFLFCFLRTGCGYSDYLNYKFYNRTAKEIAEYATIKHQDRFYEIVSPSAHKTFFTIKPNFLKNFSKYIDRDYFTDGTVEELEAFLEKNPEFMIKPYDGLGGKGVAKMTREEAGSAQALYEKMQSEHLFVEGYVKQNSQMNRMCAASVNTIRIMTFGYNGKSRILYAAMRIGNGVNHCDNFHQGGMVCALDLETGKLIGNAMDKDMNEFEVHPTSGMRFDGFQIPNWEEAKRIVLEAALVSDKIHLVGWDVAIGKDGPLVVEGNRSSSFDIIQVPPKKGQRPMLDHLIAEIKAGKMN
jgi:hypothetical protein